VKFLLDHDVPDDIAFSLEALGHPVVKLREVLSVTTPDDEVLRHAAERDCLLITCNRDDFLDVAGRMSG
jgi:predicted nuclease of predicted toxin-antitoxin system